MNAPVSRFLRIAGICGLSAVVLFSVSAGLSIALHHGFSWTGSTLSSLGTAYPSAYLFNSFLMVSGLLLFVFSRGLSHHLPEGRASWFGPGLLAGGSVFLLLTGVFTKEYHVLHFWSAFLFFSLTIMGMVLTGLSHLSRSRKTGALSVALGAFAALMYALPWPGTGLVLPEMSSIIFAMAFTVMHSSRLLGFQKQPAIS